MHQFRCNEERLMKRITVTFKDDLIAQLEDRMKEKKLNSLSECVRELVVLALKIEDAAKQKSHANKQDNEELVLLKDVRNLLKNNLTWTMESRLLSRLLVENIPSLKKPEVANILEIYKEKAGAHVKGLLKEDVD